VAVKLEVFRVRGKILSLTMIVALFSAFFVGIGHTQTPYTVYVDPPLVTGVYAGDTFDISIMITGGADVYAWEILLGYPPFVQQLTPIDFIMGDYLGPDASMAKKIDYFNGQVLLGTTMIGDQPGAYGDGWLATVRFTVIEPAGMFPLDLIYARIFLRIGDQIVEVAPEDITAISASFVGPTLNMDFNPGEPGLHKGSYVAGRTRKFKTTVSNTGYAPVWARTKVTSTKDTGEIVTLYGGQHLYTTQPRATEYYYVNGFTADFTDWTQTGTSPYLNAADASQVTGNDYCELVGMFDFADITLNPGDIIYRVTLEGLTRSANANIDFDVYDGAFNWIDSLWGTGSWSWHTTRWVNAVTSAIVPSLLTVAGFNAFQVVIHYYSPDGSPMGPAELDALRLKVEYIGIAPLTVPSTLVPVGATEMRLSDALWDLWAFNVGTYTSTFQVEYRQGTPDPRFPQYWAKTSMNTWTWTVNP
jgi:hypothetical protein